MKRSVSEKKNGDQNRIKKMKLPHDSGKSPKRSQKPKTEKADNQDEINDVVSGVNDEKCLTNEQKWAIIAFGLPLRILGNNKFPFGSVLFF